MKRHKRRPDFNGIDGKSGYTVRFAQSKDGYWWANAIALPALSVGKTVSKAKVMIAEAIQLWLEETIKMERSVPEPENKHWQISKTGRVTQT